MTSITVDHEYLTNKPKFMPKEQYDFMRNKKPIMSESSMISNYLNW